MKYANKFALAGASALALSACGSLGGGDSEAGGLQTAPAAASAPVSDFPVKIGEPYQVDGKTYTPADVVDYDEVGYASIYGRELAGRPTANGELFRADGISAAHKTLPLPSYVEVTALDTGRTILVRVNDRGPFASDRLIDPSEGAARQLGITAQGIAGVRVRKVSPTETERAILRTGGQVSTRIETPDSLLLVLRDKLAKLPKPANISVASSAPAASRPASGGTSDGRFIREGSGANSRPAPAAVSTAPQPAASTPRPDGRFVREGSGTPERAAIPPTGGYVVQLASFSSRNRADALARKLGANVEASADGRLFRVRYGPYASEQEAQSGLETARQRGYPNAKIFKQ